MIERVCRAVNMNWSNSMQRLRRGRDSTSIGLEPKEIEQCSNGNLRMYSLHMISSGVRFTPSLCFLAYKSTESYKIVDDKRTQIIQKIQNHSCGRSQLSLTNVNSCMLHRVKDRSARPTDRSSISEMTRSGHSHWELVKESAGIERKMRASAAIRVGQVEEEGATRRSWVSMSRRDDTEFVLIKLVVSSLSGFIPMKLVSYLLDAEPLTPHS